MIVLFGRARIAGDAQQFASHPVYIRVALPLIRTLENLRCLGKTIQAVKRSHELRVGFGEARKKKWPTGRRLR